VAIQGTVASSDGIFFCSRPLGEQLGPATYRHGRVQILFVSCLRRSLLGALDRGTGAFGRRHPDCSERLLRDLCSFLFLEFFISPGALVATRPFDVRKF